MVNSQKNETWQPLSPTILFTNEITLEPATSQADLYEAGISMRNALISPRIRNNLANKCSSGTYHIVLMRNKDDDIICLSTLKICPSNEAGPKRLVVDTVVFSKEMPKPFQKLLTWLTQTYANCINNGILPSHLNSVALLGDKKRREQRYMASGVAHEKTAQMAAHMAMGQ